MKKFLILLGLATALTPCIANAWPWDTTPPSKPPVVAVSTFNNPSDWGSPSSGGTVDLTKNYYVVFDGSGSMNESECSGGNKYGRIEPAKTIMVQFGMKLPSDANLGLYIFDAHAWAERVALGPISKTLPAYEREIKGVVANSGTPLGSSLKLAYEALRLQSLKQNGYGEYHIVVVTDGGDTDNDRALMPKMVDKITKSPIILETIGFCISSGHALNQPGKTIYRNAMNPTELQAGLKEILAESEIFIQQGSFK